MLHLAQTNDALYNKIEVCSQNVSAYDSGAYTSQISADQLIDMDCKWAIIGHSERRVHFKESDQDVAVKVNKALGAGMKVVLCVGETMLQRETGKTREVIESMLLAVQSEIDAQQWVNVSICYEPIWAVGTGNTPTPISAQHTHSEIREWLTAEVSEEIAECVRIIFGGSVNAQNCRELIKMKDIDGFLVGRASMTPEFSDIVETVDGIAKVKYDG